jgi:hypothetical protein
MSYLTHSRFGGFLFRRAARPCKATHIALLLTVMSKLEFVGLLTFHISTLASRLPDHQDREALPSALLTSP